MFWTYFFVFLVIFAALAWLKNRDKPVPQHIPTRRETMDAFLQSAKKIHVNLDECEVRTGYDKIIDTGELPFNPATGTALSDAYFAGNLAMALGPEETPKEDKDVFYCRILYKTTLNGKPRSFYSDPIRKDDKTLLFLMSAQKSTTLFVDSYDPAKYWMDTRFLESA
jgi:hypothetical protein